MQFLSHNTCSCMLSVKGLRIATSGVRVKYCSTYIASEVRSCVKWSLTRAYKVVTVACEK